MAPAWLTARPVAHRGLHDAAVGVIENTASAFTAAVTNSYGIECDVQISADGEAMVHHDEALGRLTDGNGRLADMSAAAIKAVPFKATSDRIMTLGELCDLVAGRVALVVELKSIFSGDTRIALRAAEVLASYKGAAALMSFDPLLIATLRETAPQITRGIVAERHYTQHGKPLPAAGGFRLGHMLHAPYTRPHFIAYNVRDLPSPAPFIARAFGVPVLTWTVRDADDRQRAKRWADQVIFEGWRP